MSSGADFFDVKKGDTVVRMLAGTVRLELLVTEVTETEIICATPRGNDAWHFDRQTGIEIDDYLGFGPTTGITGSFLVKERI